MAAFGGLIPFTDYFSATDFSGMGMKIPGLGLRGIRHNDFQLPRYLRGVNFISPSPELRGIEPAIFYLLMEKGPLTIRVEKTLCQVWRDIPVNMQGTGVKFNRECFFGIIVRRAIEKG